MLVIWSWKYRAIGAESTDLQCGHCAHENLILTTFQFFFHIFFIPLLPLRKERELSCPACETVYDAEINAPELLAEEGNVRTPWWGYSGIMIAALILGLMIYDRRLDRKLVQEVFESPHAGDIIFYKTLEPEDKSYPYSFLKVDQVMGTVLVLKDCAYSYSKLRTAQRYARGRGKKQPTKLYSESFELSMADFIELKPLARSAQRAYAAQNVSHSITSN